MSTTTTLSDSISASVPQLESDGTNWVIFETRFREAVDPKGYWSHFDGSNPRPSEPTETMSAAAVSDRRVMLGKWIKDESSAKSLLTQKLPDDALMLVRSLDTVQERWAALKREYEQKGDYEKGRLKREFLEMRCENNGDVRAFCQDLRVRKSKLAAMGVDLPSSDILNTFLYGLYEPFSSSASLLVRQSRLSSVTLTAEVLMHEMTEEYNRWCAANGRHAQSAGPGLAMAADASRGYGGGGGGGYRGRGGGRGWRPRTCWNCGKQGHLQRDCTLPRTSGEPTNTATETANIAVESTLNPSNAATPTPPPRITSEWAFSAELTTPDPFPTPHTAVAAPLAMWEDDPDLVEVFPDYEESVPIDPLADEPIIVAANLDSFGLDDAIRAELYDSGCSRHITPYREDLLNFVDITPRRFSAANKQEFHATGMGDMVVEVPNGVGTSRFRLRQVLYASGIPCTLVSIGCLDREGYRVLFADQRCRIKAPDGHGLAIIPLTPRGTYRVTHHLEEAMAVQSLSLEQLHRRLGHISIAAAKKVVDQGLVTGIKRNRADHSEFHCEACLYGKATDLPIPKERQHAGATEVGEKTHSDLWGPAKVASLGGKLYYILFTDDYSRYVTIEFLRLKSLAFQAYKIYEAWMLRQLGKPLKVLHADNGGEYRSEEFDTYRRLQGTEFRPTIPETPQENGIAERLNRVLGEGARCLLGGARHLPVRLWAEAMRHKLWLKNRTLTKAVNGMTPFEAMFGSKPDLSLLRDFGETTWVHTHANDKLGSRVEKGYWVGVDNDHGHRIYYPHRQQVLVERNVYFDNTSGSRSEGEDVPVVPPSPDDAIPAQKPPTPDPTPVPAEPEPEPIPEAELPVEPEEPAEERSKRVRKPSKRVQDLLTGVGQASSRPRDPKIPAGVQLPTPEPDDDHIPGAFSAEFAMVADMKELVAIDPKDLADAKSRPDWLLWKEAMGDELGALGGAHTWKLVKPPPGANVIGSKWVLTHKLDASGHVERRKARLVAQGFAQIEGVPLLPPLVSNPSASSSPLPPSSNGPSIKSTSSPPS
ncbi:hypothetical protein ONZ45_g9375 [Pleurotus djamor]|nr:hypothetical protein ONZ45_g9375 [Pleurotus djamor]